MATPEEIKAHLSKWVKKMEDPEVKKKFKGFNKTMQHIFPDIDYKIKMVWEDQTLRLEEGIEEDADMTLETNSDLYIGILTGMVDPMEAFQRRDLKISGDFEAMQKLEILTQD
jgi:predicted lipid carrier protein YhbT